MRKSYKLYNHEYCKAHVEIHFDENNNASKIELWSYNTRVCGAYITLYGQWKVFCAGTYSQTTRRQIGWFLKDIGAPFTYYSAKRSFEHDSDIIAIK